MERGQGDTPEPSAETEGAGPAACRAADVPMLRLRRLHRAVAEQRRAAHDRLHEDVAGLLAAADVKAGLRDVLTSLDERSGQALVEFASALDELAEFSRLVGAGRRLCDALALLHDEVRARLGEGGWDAFRRSLRERADERPTGDDLERRVRQDLDDFVEQLRAGRPKPSPEPPPAG